MKTKSIWSQKIPKNSSTKIGNSEIENFGNISVHYNICNKSTYFIDAGIQQALVTFHKIMYSVKTDELKGSKSIHTQFMLTHHPSFIY